MRKRLDAVRLAAGIKEWPNDAARHSFATYHLALHQNSALTSHELGHRNPNTLFKHYRNLATKAEGEAYFAIVPGVHLPNYLPSSILRTSTIEHSKHSI
jgi:integrase